MTSASALYFGKVVHKRFRPKTHFLAYRVFWLFLDLAEMEEAGRRLRWFSTGRFNLISFHPRDHGDGTDIPLRDQITPWLDQAGVSIGDGPIRLLTMPRILGYVFNPISIYYCYDANERLKALVYEVTSTFKHRHSYVIPAAASDTEEGRFEQAAAKALYVSPFMDMEMGYVFRGHLPSDILNVVIDGHDAQGKLIHASISAERQPLTDRSLLRALAGFPLLTLKVVGAIHWEALRLWLKGVGLTRQPPPSDQATVQTETHRSRLGRM